MTFQNNADEYILQSKKLLFRTLNCCESQIIPFQNAHDLDYDKLLKAVTGLAGGVYNRGSTCGVIFGASLNLAMLKNNELESWSPGDELSLLEQVAEYIKWFEDEFGGTLCRDRTNLDFQTIRGKIGLLIPKKAKGCVKQSALSLKYLLNVSNNKKVIPCSSYKHCATDVLREVRVKTGIGDKTIEQLTTVLDGGIGMSGGGCGALAGGIIALGLQFGNEHTKKDAFKMRNILRTLPRKFSKITNELIDQFEDNFGGIECERVIGYIIDGFDEFLVQRDKCQLLVNWMTENIIDISQ